MSLLELKEQVSLLPFEEQAELASSVAERLRRDDVNYRKELGQMIDDSTPGNWLRWSELKKEKAL
jgi:hypothetical protein